MKHTFFIIISFFVYELALANNLSFMELKKEFNQSVEPQVDELINHKNWDCSGKSIKSIQDKVSLPIKMKVNFDFSKDGSKHEVTGYFSTENKNLPLYQELASFEVPLKFESSTLVGLPQKSYFNEGSQKVDFKYSLDVKKSEALNTLLIQVNIKSQDILLKDLNLLGVNALLSCK